MASLELEITITDDGSPSYEKTFLASDSNDLVYAAYMAICPRTKSLFFAAIKSLYHDSEDAVVTDIEFKLTESSVTKYTYLVENMTGKKRKIYGALIGIGNLAFDEIMNYMQQNYT